MKTLLFTNPELFGVRHAFTRMMRAPRGTTANNHKKGMDPKPTGTLSNAQLERIAKHHGNRSQLTARRWTRRNRRP